LIIPGIPTAIIPGLSPWGWTIYKLAVRAGRLALWSGGVVSIKNKNGVAYRNNNGMAEKRAALAKVEAASTITVVPEARHIGQEMGIG
jgi:hypothetical protein